MSLMRRTNHSKRNLYAAILCSTLCSGGEELNGSSRLLWRRRFHAISLSEGNVGFFSRRKGKYLQDLAKGDIKGSGG